MSNRVKLHPQAFTAFRQSAEVRAAVDGEADRLAASANRMGSRTIHAGIPIYRAVPAIGTAQGTVALVSTRDSMAATIDNAAHNTLLKALGGA